MWNVCETEKVLKTESIGKSKLRENLLSYRTTHQKHNENDNL